MITIKLRTAAEHDAIKPTHAISNVDDAAMEA